MQVLAVDIGQRSQIQILIVYIVPVEFKLCLDF